MKILLTGAAGFIGYHATKKLCSNKRNRVIGIDSLNSYYDKKLKINRIKNLKKKYKKNFVFYKINLCDKKKIFSLFRKNKFDKVINLAAQAGVRYSLENPEAYFTSNLEGFFKIKLIFKLIFIFKHVYFLLYLFYIISFNKIIF